MNPTIELRCRVEADFLLAMERAKLEDVLEREISPGTEPHPSDGEVDLVILGYAAHMLSRYQLGQQVLRPASTRFEVDVAASKDSIKETHWTLLPNESISKIHPDDGAEHIRTMKGRLPHWRVIGAQLVSPVFDFTYFEHMFPMFRHIQNVLTDAEAGIGDRQWLDGVSTNRHMSWTNETCSLRIQLAYDGREIPFRTIQNLVATWVVYEDAIEMLQPVHHHGYNIPLAFTLSTRFPVSANKETYRMAIYHCKTLPELRNLVGLYATAGGEAKINFLTFSQDSGLGRSLQSQAHTIEFREHAGTLNADDIKWWMLFTSKMLRFAQALTDANLIFDAHGDFHVIGLLKLIGFPRQGQDFYMRRLEELAH
ncbi:MAG: hypothetical protein M1830_001871 [Pleopsidium flavum]|nr:MAG: hypothetical protein M1830_001871 [Pleopsidium flavum]